jgi:hypothetical protein
MPITSVNFKSRGVQALCVNRGACGGLDLDLDIPTVSAGTSLPPANGPPFPFPATSFGLELI